MHFTRSIGFRLTLWYSLILTATLILFGILIHWSLDSRLTNGIRRQLEERSNAFERFVMAEAAEQPPVALDDEIFEFCQALPESSWLEMTRPDGTVTFRYPQTGKPAGPFASSLKHLMIGGQPINVEMGASLAEVHRTLGILSTLLLGLIPAALVLACGVGAWLSRQALRPVAAMTAAAQRISISNLSTRLPTRESGDELENLARTWNIMLDRLESAVRTLSQFAADASHELRTPLAVIRTSAELALRRAREPEAYRQSLSEIASETERMTQLVENLLFLARGDSGAVEMPREPMDLRLLMEEVIGEIRTLAAARGISPTTSFPAQGAMVCGNRDALRRLFLVLLDNAIKFAPEGGEVTVSLTKTGDGWIASVGDNGPGIAPEDLPHIFERFYRSSHPHVDVGHGLGLSLAASIAAAHSISIQVENSPDLGSRFYLHFPQAAVAVA